MEGMGEKVAFSELGSWHPRGSAQSLVTVAPWDLLPSFGLPGYLHTRAQTHRAQMHVNKNKVSLFKKLIGGRGEIRDIKETFPGLRHC